MSKRFTLSKEDLFKILKGGLIAVCSAGAVAGLDWLEQLPQSIDFGLYEAIAVSVVSTLVNAGRKFLTDTTK